jgi:hypothetical protein
MQKPMLQLKAALMVVLIAVWVGSWVTLAWAGQPSTTPPNWAQVDRTSPWTCPTPSGTTGD